MTLLDPLTVTAIMFGAMLALMAIGAPLAYALGIVATGACIFLWGINGVEMLVLSAYGLMNVFVLVALPLFIFMGLVLQRSGIADDLFEMFSKTLGSWKGGMGIGVVIICALIAAMAGVTGAATVSLGIIALPPMLNHGYHKRLVTGTIMAGGALGFLIPPSVSIIFYAYLARQSTGKLFAAGVLPGIMLAIMYILYILIICHFKPSLGPAVPPEDRINWLEKLKSLKALILPGALIFAVLGLIFMGITSPTEASAIGAAGALVCAALHRRFNWELIKSSLQETTRIMGMLMWIGVAAVFFSKIYIGLGASRMIKNILQEGGLGPYSVLLIILATFFILGMFLDDSAILFITVPLYVPLIISLGFDPVWFGIIFIVSMQSAYLSPPFGYNLFYMRAVAPPEITIIDIYRSVVPYIILQIVGVIILIVFPEIVLWLPSVIFD